MGGDRGRECGVGDSRGNERCEILFIETTAHKSNSNSDSDSSRSTHHLYGG
jgi:hypothetical protein